MENFYAKLKQTQEESYIKDHIKDFEMLDNKTIENLFQDRNIPFEWKEKIMELGYNRIIRLPFNVFLVTLNYIENSELLISKYQNRINSLSYDEFIRILYEANLNGDCFIKITEMSAFKRYLSYEQATKIGTKVQSFLFLKGMYLSDQDPEKLIFIGKKINQFLSANIMEKEDLKFLIDHYLCSWLAKEDSLKNDVTSIGMVMIGNALKNHILLSNSMIEFYILSRIKELDLEKQCQNIFINNQDFSSFGYYQESTGTLVINIEYLKKRFIPIFKEDKIEDKNSISDFLNLNMLGMISHELGHIVRHKSVANFGKNLHQDSKKLGQNQVFYYWYKNGILKSFLKEKNYKQFHDQFIEENRADLFMIFDSERTIQKYFKDCFPKKKIQDFCKLHASKIVDFYTKKKEDKWHITSPREKFDIFYDSFNIKEETLPDFSPTKEVDTKESIIKRLLLGDRIPSYLLEGIHKIAKGEVITVDIYTTIKEILNEKDLLSEAGKRKL